MALPSEIIVGKTTYKIEWVDSIDEVDIYSKKRISAQIDYKYNVIRICANGLNRTQRLAVLLHEVNHAIVQEYGMKEVIEHKEYEEIVDNFAVAYAKLLIDNNLEM